ncbi:hypothetical protein U2F26_27865 [Micromonospora sp. 4G57]|uniref:Uncharacterized protein n=1 Tax=Micromonospora sicca TaxID=2202420 RepID=A0ABU5JNT5_9ACTN|nr:MULTISPECIES: hypothetical protein [unclassified Micromonospora]MDZ5446499.1 hypothetical protein [Micromonospora sp. 4G57]MDZ5494024.1 hypothetical protein [Micromonospora sp. 4G53]
MFGSQLHFGAGRRQQLARRPTDAMGSAMATPACMRSKRLRPESSTSARICCKLKIK